MVHHHDGAGRPQDAVLGAQPVQRLQQTPPCSHRRALAPLQLLSESMTDHRRLDLVHLLHELRLPIQVEVRHELEVLPVLDLVQVVLLLKVQRTTWSALK